MLLESSEETITQLLSLDSLYWYIQLLIDNCQSTLDVHQWAMLYHIIYAR